MKIKIIYKEGDLFPPNLIDPTVRELLHFWFDFEAYQEGMTLDPQGTILLIPYVAAGEWAFDLQQQGFRVAVDNLMEPTSRYLASPGYHRLDPALTHEIKSDLWFWCEEHCRLLYYRKLGWIPEYSPNRTFEKLAFMPMRMQRWHRDQIFKAMTPLLPLMYYSYQDKGIMLPGDVSPRHPGAQRFFHPSWYDHTCFSIAVETMVDEYNTNIWGHEQRITYLGPWPFLTEKTFKPISLQHPFMILGHSHTLRTLHDLGFESFANIFDESYDHQLSCDDKIKIIYNNSTNFDRSVSGYDNITQQKIMHNYQLFFDPERIKNILIEDIIQPLLQYAHKT